MSKDPLPGTFRAWLNDSGFEYKVMNKPKKNWHGAQIRIFGNNIVVDTWPGSNHKIHDITHNDRYHGLSLNGLRRLLQGKLLNANDLQSQTHKNGKKL